MEIDRSLNPNPKLAGVHPTFTRGTPSAPGSELTDMSGDDGIVRQRALVGDSLNDE